MALQVRQRVTDVLFDYWNEIRGDRAYPSIEDIDESKLKDVWDDSFLIEVFPLVLGSGYRFLHKGQNIGDVHEKQGGKFIRNMVLGFVDNASDRYAEVVKNKKIIKEEDVFKSGGVTVKYRQILLPLGPSAEKVNGILGGMRFIKE